ncbi:MAG: hypothetical protein JST82_15510 [Bacteroidetes bacterium]|nr:hypothetical protein [Bacteroidota bacterium]
MKLRYYLPLILLICFGINGYSQSKYRSSLQDYYLQQQIEGNLFFKRLSIAACKHFIPGNAELHFNGFADSTFRDSTFKSSLRSKQSYAFYIGSYLPISIISDNSMMVLNIELMGAVTQLTYDSVRFSKKTAIATSFQTVKVGIPVSIEYRQGADVMLNKKSGAMFTLGAGGFLGIINSDDYNLIKPYRLNAFIKAELGFVAVVAIKIRAQYYFGTALYAYTEDYDLAGQPSLTKTNYKGSSGFDLGVVLMPFSLGWNRGR